MIARAPFGRGNRLIQSREISGIASQPVLISFEVYPLRDLVRHKNRRGQLDSRDGTYFELGYPTPTVADVESGEKREDGISLDARPMTSLLCVRTNLVATLDDGQK